MCEDTFAICADGFHLRGDRLAFCADMIYLVRRHAGDADIVGRVSSRSGSDVTCGGRKYVS